jgi:hypothetical protein
MTAVKRVQLYSFTFFELHSFLLQILTMISSLNVGSGTLNRDAAGRVSSHFLDGDVLLRKRIRPAERWQRAASKLILPPPSTSP